MREGAIVLRGGTVVTAYGVAEADVWIEQGKIRRVFPSALPGTRGESEQAATVLDISGHFLLPGWVGLVQLQTKENLSSAHFRDAVRSLVRNGVTCVVDTVELGEGMHVQDLLYKLTPHYDSPIDYGARVRVSCRTFRPQLVRLLGKHGFRLLEVTVEHPRELDEIPWLDLFPFLHKARMALHLHLPEERVGPRLRKEIALAWLRHCAYGKVRTCVAGVDPLAWRKEEAFYGIVSVDEDQLGRVFQHLRRHWYGYLPVICPTQPKSAAIAIRQWESVELLCLLVRIMSTNVAKAIGCYPVKGSLIPGADADVILLEKGEWLTKFDGSSILKINELCQPSRVMSKGRWLLDRGAQFFPIGYGIRLRNLQPYNYAF